MSIGPAPDLARHVTDLLDELLAAFRIVILHGARQVGKTTIVRSAVAQSGGSAIDLDDPLLLDAVRADPGGVLVGLRRPVFVDEFQRGGPALVLAVKQAVDRDRRRGQFVLTGSANHLAAQHHVDTLAGRNVRLTVWPFSQGELRGRRERFIELAFASPGAVLDLPTEPLDRSGLVSLVVRGGYPEIVLGDLSTAMRQRWVASYVADCTDREALRGVAEIRKTDELRQLFAALAARSASELVLQGVKSALGERGAALDHRTLVQFLDLLEALHLIHRVPAWSTNRTSRARKHAKVHLTDAGIAAGVLRIDADALAGDGADRLLGPLVETFVVDEIAKQCSWHDRSLSLHHLRNDRHEVDLIIEDDAGKLVAIEIKAGPVQSHHAADLAWLRDLHPSRFVAGFVLHGGTNRLPLGDRIWAVPIPTMWA